MEKAIFQEIGDKAVEKANFQDKAIFQEVVAAEPMPRHWGQKKAV